MNASWGVVSVMVNITHTAVGDLYVALISPDGTFVDLSVLRGGTSNNFPGTVFNSSAGTNITAAATPYTAGPYAPEDNLGNFNLGTTSTGIWNLLVWDLIGGDVGTVNSWSVTFSNAPATPVLWMSSGCTINLPVSPMNFYDEGGPSANYYNSTDWQRTICSSNNTCLRATFTARSLSSGGACLNDYLDVFDGTTVAYTTPSPWVGSICNTALVCNAGTGATCTAASNIVTSTTGCLTFVFHSNATTVSTGWTATLSNVAGCAAIPRPANDVCSGAVTLTTTGSNANALGCDMAGIGNAISGASNCGWNSTDNSTFYTFNVTAGTPQPVRVDLTGTTCSGGGNAIQLAIFDNNCNTVGLYGSNYHGCASGTGAVSVTASPNPLPTGTYILAVDGQAGASCNFTFNGAVVLPVDLKSFSLYKEKNMAKLEWITSSEINSNHFEIQRSDNGKNFVTLTQVKATGAPSTETEYVYYDEAPLKGLNYYRIVQADNDGEKRYFPLRQVDFSSEINSFAVYPNPLEKSELTIDISSEKEYLASLEIYDSKGTCVKRTSLIVKNDDNRFLVDTGSLQNGLYIVKVVTPSNSRQQKLIINKE